MKTKLADDYGKHTKWYDPQSGDDSRIVALRSLAHKAEQLVKEMEFAFDDVPAGVDAHIANLRIAIADARQQL